MATSAEWTDTGGGVVIFGTLEACGRAVALLDNDSLEGRRYGVGEALAL